MKRILFAAAVAMAVAAADARADWGWGQGAAAPAQAAAAPGQAAAAPAQAGGDCYGWHPGLKRLMWWKKDCKGGNCGGSHGGAGAGAGPAGTLVFPQHQFARSPRDWFMTGY
jgi:hypothetical protein